MRSETVFTAIGADPVRAMRCVLDVHGGLAVNDPKESTRFCEQSSGTGKAREAYRSTFPLLLGDVRHASQAYTNATTSGVSLSVLVGCGRGTVHQGVTGEQRPPRSTVWFEHELQSGQIITSPNQCAPAPAAPLGNQTGRENLA